MHQELSEGFRSSLFLSPKFVVFIVKVESPSQAVAVHTFGCSTQEAKAGVSESEASLGYTERPCKGRA